MTYSGMQHRVGLLYTDVSDDRVASTFKIEEMYRGILFLPRVISFTLKMEPTRSSER
jgi:hypothetical protein